MTKNTNWFNNDIYINEINLIRLVTGVVGFFGNFRYETVDLELGRSSEHRYYGERTNILVSNTDIVTVSYTHLRAHET